MLAEKVAKPNVKEIRDAAYWFLCKKQVPLPLSPDENGDPTKRPTIDGWQKIEISVGDVDRLFTEGSNIGLRLDTLTDVDLDSHESIFLATRFLKHTAARWGRDTARHSHYLYKVENSQAEQFLDPMVEGDKNKKMIVEIRHGNGMQSMVPPSVHPCGELLRWEEGNPEPAVWTYHDLRRAMGRIAAGVLLIRYLKPGARHNAWLYLAGAMRRAEWTVEEALYFARVVSEARKDEQPENLYQAVQSTFDKESGEEIGGLKKLEDYLPKPVVRKLAQWLDLKFLKSDPLDLTDDANAQGLFAELGEDLRYLPNEGKGGLWAFWNDVTWQRDRLGYVDHLAGGTLKKKSDQLTTGSREGRFVEKVRRELLNMAGINGALDRLSVYPEIATASDQFDANPWLVGLENGVYNLETDRLEEGAREHLVSRQMRAAYDPNAKCPRWLAALERAQPNSENRAFVQRLGGSCLLGMQTEHGFVFNFGPGANFKTALAEILRRMMNDYALTPNDRLFFEGNQEVPLNFVADIQGMRLLVTNEKKEGSEWNIEFIKQLLGGQELSACRKYCEAFEFVPTARVIVAANNKPRLNELDEALRRRFLLVPWDVTIPETVANMPPLSPTETDSAVILNHLHRGPRIPFEQLMTLLLEERSGILNWMLEGFRDFKSRGLRLAPPKAIQDATEEYFEEENLAGRFVKEWCSPVSIPENLSEIEIVTFLRDKGSYIDLIHHAFNAWAELGRYSWGKSKLTRRLQKVAGVITRRGTGNRMLANIVLSDKGRESYASRAEESVPEEIAM